MTINIADNSPRISYSVADGVTQTSFSVPFEFFDDEDLNVYVDGVEKTLTTDFTVSGGDGSTGTVTISVTGASGGSTVVITRDIPLERTTDFPVSGAFNIVALNTELDRLVAVAADLDDLASRAITPLDYDPTVSYTLPTVDDRKGKTLAFNEVTGSVQAGPSIADTQSVSNASADIALLADIQDGTVATNAITTAANVSSEIATLGAISSDITTVSGISSNVTTVASNDANVTTVAGISSNVTTVADNIADINTVADDLNEAVSEINTVATDITNVNTVGTNITNVNTTAGSINNVNTVASDITNINTVSTNISNVNTVAGISANVTTVAGQTTNLQNVTDNLTAIQNASSNATSASNSATAAAASAAAAALSADTFDDTYLGSKASDPSLDNDGDALNAGDLYFNTTSNTLKVYSGSAWQDAAVDSSSFVQTAGDTMTGNLSFGDNDKAIFGAGSDLQIYHNGSHSYISDTAVGDLKLKSNGTNITFEKADGTDIFNVATSGATTAYYNGNAKLATTSTGIDVTGTVTADGLTVNSGGDQEVYFGDAADGIALANTGAVSSVEFGNSQGAGGVGKFTYDRSTGKLVYAEGPNGSEDDFFAIDSTGKVGIGTSLPSQKLEVSDTSNQNVALRVTNNDGNAEMQKYQDDLYLNLNDTGNIIVRSGSPIAERMRIDSSGNLLVGKTSSSASTTGAELQAGSGGQSALIATAAGTKVGVINRTTSDGDLLEFRKDGTTVGSVGSASGATIYIDGGSQFAGLQFGGDGVSEGRITPRRNGASADAATDLGTSSLRFKDLYLSGGTKYGSSTDFGQIRKTGGELQIDSYGSGGARNPIKFTQYTSEAARFDASGNLLVGTTDSTPVGSGSNGTAIGNGIIESLKYKGAALKLDRYGDSNNANDGSIIEFYSGSSGQVGSIGVTSGQRLTVGSSVDTNVGLVFQPDTDKRIYPVGDGVVELGRTGHRFKDLMLSGGVYLGGTGAANKLDDYEEGTWTPAMGGTTTSPTVSYSSRSGKYTKIGRIVHLNFYINISSYSGGSGLSIIQGMPFGAVNEDAVYFYYGGGSSKSIDRGAIQSHSGGRIVLGQDSAGGINFVNCSDMVSGGGLIIGNVTYETT